MDEPDNDLFSEVNWDKAERSQHGLASEQTQRTLSGRAEVCWKRQGNTFLGKNITIK